MIHYLWPILLFIASYVGTLWLLEFLDKPVKKANEYSDSLDEQIRNNDMILKEQDQQIEILRKKITEANKKTLRYHYDVITDNERAFFSSDEKMMLSEHGNVIDMHGGIIFENAKSIRLIGIKTIEL